MYKPAPPRPKKTNIVRSRNGCKSCRERKSKCDEKQPVCGTCTRLGKKCERYQPQFKFQSVYPATQEVDASSTTSREIEKDDPDLQVIARRNSTSLKGENLSSIGNFDLIRSLQHSERNIFYSTIWEDHCLPAMHPIFQTLSNGFFDHSILADATLALSSCSFSRLYPEQKFLATSEMGSLSPDLVHQTRSQLYYSSAIRKVAALSEKECHDNASIILTVLIIFGYIEGSMGNFQGFYCHDQGIICLLSNLQLGSEKNLDALLAAWLQIRIVVWWARVNFCSLEVLRTLPSVMPPGITIEGFDRPQDRRVTVLSNMCESHQSNFSALLRHWDTSDLNVQMEKTYVEDEEMEIVSNFLAGQGKKLDKWIESLPSSELAINWPTDSQYFGNMDSHEAILFHSNEAALNFAYYALGRIMQCTGLLQSLRAGYPANYYDFYTEEFWTRLLLRIARGTNMETLLKMNSYTIGLSGLLLTALLRCQSQELGLEIQSWLQDLESMKPTEEGAFPLYQTLRVVKTINRQKMAERDVIAVTLSVDDEGGTPKFNAYNSQPITGLLFHGIIRSSGELFTDYLLVDL